MSPENRPCHKIVVLGEGGVGKSALTVQYVSNIFLDFHDPTIEDVYQTERTIDGHTCVLDILDTAGQEEVQSALRDHNSQFHGDGYVAVYSISDPRSFRMLRSHIQSLKRLRNFENIPLVLVGNKTDLFSERKVSTAEGVSLAREIGCPFYEASARSTINVDDVFSGVVRKIRQHHRQERSANNFRLIQPKIKTFRKYMRRRMEDTWARLHAFSQS